MRIAEYTQIDTKIVQEEVIIPAQYDDDGNVISEERMKIVKKEVPVMGMVYRDATPEEIAEMEANGPTNDELIEQYKAELSATDYKAIKYAEGWLTEEEYAPIKAERERIRNEIRELEKWMEIIDYDISSQIKECFI